MAFKKIHVVPIRGEDEERDQLPSRRTARKRESAFSLVEMALAMGVVSFCLLTLLALLPMGLRSADASSRESTAINIGNGIFSDLKATASYAASSSLTTIPATSRFGISIPTSAGKVQNALYLDRDGNPVTAANATYLAILTLISPAITGSNTSAGLPKPAVLAHLLITWPAAANSGLSTSQLTLTSPTQDLRAQLKGVYGTVELTGSVDLEQ